ncbi:hypothetical protein PENSPDRAFT_690264 [Peniophora sp. CONT]|nr:hypothetical protein PENSPDRAFT_690264 [Peniophora sp. CONT]
MQHQTRGHALSMRSATATSNVGGQRVNMSAQTTILDAADLVRDQEDMFVAEPSVRNVPAPSPPAPAIDLPTVLPHPPDTHQDAVGVTSAQDLEAGVVPQQPRPMIWRAFARISAAVQGLWKRLTGREG